MYKRVISLFLCLTMIISLLPINAFANMQQRSDFNTTVDVGPLLTDVAVEGAALVDGRYTVEMGKSYNIKLTFQENDTLEMDMSGYIYFDLPAGITPAVSSGTIEIGVEDYNSIYHPIYHTYNIEGNRVIISWNTEDENFKNYLTYAHGVTFNFGLSTMFNGSQSEVKFGTNNETVIIVDNSGSATINKVVVDEKGNAIALDENQMRRMTFKLYGPNGYERRFTYFDMANGAITYTDLVPGDYRVIEEAYPVLPDHTFNQSASVQQVNVKLEPGQSIVMPLSNVYTKDKGTIELQKTVTGLGDNIPDNIKELITFDIIDHNDNTVKTVNYSQFTGGKLQITDLATGEYTVIERNGVTGYSCTYKVNGSPVSLPYAEVTVRKNQTSSVSFENTYQQQTSDLIVRKTASGAAVPAGTQFTVTSDNGYSTTFTYAEMTADGNGRYYKLENLPLGIYTVKETSGGNVATYSLKITGEGSVELAENNGEKTKEIHNQYTPVGSLEIKKSVSIQNGTLTNELKRSLRNKIVFEVFNSNNEKVGTVTYGDILDGNATLSNLPVGTYTVKETASSIAGYTMISAATQTLTVEIKHNQKAESSFTNTYKKDSYKLTLNKEFGTDSAYNANNLPESIRNNTKFTIKDANGNKVTLKDSQGASISNPVTYAQVAGGLDLYLDGPGPYTVTESNPSVQGVDISTQVSAGDAYKTGKSTSIQLENHGTNTVTFRNTYTQLAIIKGDKTIIGLNSSQKADVENKITFTITRTDTQAAPITVTLAQLKAGVQVPAGTYKVMENTDTASVKGYTTTVTVKAGENGTVISGADTGNFNVAHNQTVTVQFTNTYNIDGDNGISVVKTVTGLDGVSGQLPADTDLYRAISFKLEEKTAAGSWRTFGTYTLAQLAAGVDLPVGNYRITELNADKDGYDLEISYRIENSEWTDGLFEFKITKDSRVTISVRNAYTQLGDLKITKSFSGIGADSLSARQKEKIVFTVKHISGSPEYTVKYSEFQNGSYTFNDIPVGIYTVAETADDTTNHRLLSVISAPANGQATVRGTGTATVGFTNTYERKTGNLKVTKVLDGINESLTAEQKEAMVFTLKDQSGKTVQSVTYAQFTNGEYTFENLPTGKYSVDETIGNVLSGRYDVNVIGKNEEVSVEYNKTVETEITNIFTAIGSLQLVKTFGSAVPLTTDISFEIRQNNQTVKTIRFRDFTYDNDSASYRYTENNLPTGIYTVVEQDNTSGYKRTTTVKIGDGEPVNDTEAEISVEMGNTSTVEFNNSYIGDPAIRIKKTITGLTAMTDEQKNAITFTVTGYNGYSSSFRYSDMVNGEMVINNLQPGQYTVTETVVDQLFREYTRVTQYKVGAAEAQNGTQAVFTAEYGEYQVEFINNYTFITPLKVEKDCIKEQSMLVTEDGNYPIWRFTLTISNLNPNTTQDGKTAFTDVFDATYAEWFRLAETQEVQRVFGTEEKSSYIKAISAGNTPAANFDTAKNEIVISGINENTAQVCEFVYYLIIKDRDALEKINSPAAENADGVLRDFCNVVTYKPMPYSAPVTAEAIYEYSFTAVDKDIANLKDDKLVITQNGKDVLVNYADYSVILNEDEVTIGNQPQIVATDTFSGNQTVLYDSIVTNPEVPFELDNTAHTIKFYIPNSTRVEVSYRAVIANNDNNKISLSNNIRLNGFVVNVEEEVERNVVGSGLAKIYAVKLFKVDAAFSSKQLEGVVFDLYDGETDRKLTEGTTNEKGSIIFASWINNGQKDSLRPDHDYYLVERSTVPGYNLINQPIRFRLSNRAGATPEIDQNGVHILVAGTNNELIVKNQPVTATMQVIKDFNGWGKDEWENITFSFALKDENRNTLQTVTVTKDNPVAVFDSIHYDTITDEDVADGKVVTYKYYIQEVLPASERVEGIFYDTTEHPVIVTISAGEENGTKDVNIDYGEYSALTVINYECVEISVSKIWEDNDNQDGIQPAEITVELLADGTATGKTLTLSADNNWYGIFANLPKYKCVDEIAYTVTEANVPDGYESVITGTAANGFVITNTHTPELIDISGEKTWYDDDNRDGLRPDVITINLLKDGEVIDSRDITEDDDWSWTFTNLPKYEAGNLISYTVMESAVENYSAEYDGYNVINGYTPGRTSVSVLKIWKDNNQPGFRPKQITVRLLADGKATDKTLVLNADNNWSGTFTDLYIFEAGEKIVYTIEEIDVPAGYTSETAGNATDGFVITNTKVPDVPDTSDNTNTPLWTALFVISGSMILCIFAYRKRKVTE